MYVCMYHTLSVCMYHTLSPEILKDFTPIRRVIKAAKVGLHLPCQHLFFFVFFQGQRLGLEIRLGRQGSDQGLRFRVQAHTRVEGVARRVQGFRVLGAGFAVQHFAGIWGSGGGCRVQGAGCRVQGAGCRVQGVGVGCRALGVGGSGETHTDTYRHIP